MLLVLDADQLHVRLVLHGPLEIDPHGLGASTGRAEDGEEDASAAFLSVSQPRRPHLFTPVTLPVRLREHELSALPTIELDLDRVSRDRRQVAASRSCWPFGLVPALITQIYWRRCLGLGRAGGWPG